MPTKPRGAGDNQAKILTWLKGHPGEHKRAAIETGTKLPPGSVVSALRVLREDGKLNARQEGTNAKAAYLYAAK